MAVFIPKDRHYSEKTWDMSGFVTALEYMHLMKIDPVKEKLLYGDKYDLKNKNVLRISPFRKKLIPGILVTSGNTYGRKKNKLYYKCIPNDKSLPVFLIPYLDKSANFSKSKLDKYVLFNFDNWNDKHPHGVLQQTIGEVNDMSAFEEHQMNCKEINHSIQKFSKQAYKTLIQKKTSQSKDVIDDMMAKYDILDRTNENVISIDPEGCTDIDDALSVKFDKESPWKTTISIYIAHVPIWFEYLDLWHLLDRRVSTVYLTSEKRTMLPTILSENLCSLKKKQRRFAIAMDILMNGSKIVGVEFNNVLIKVSNNYSYDDNDLVTDNTFQEAEIFAKKINKSYAFIDEVSDSHDVVQLYMVMMNNYLGKHLRDEVKSNAIFRSFKSADVNEIMLIPNEMKDFARTWKSEGGIYTINSKSTHDMMNSIIDVYAHCTSPIRRLVDLINMTVLSHSKGIVGKKGKAFVETWVSKINYINSQMKATRKVQNDVKLLNTCLNIQDLSDRKFDGYIIEVEELEEREKIHGIIKEINYFII